MASSDLDAQGFAAASAAAIDMFDREVFDYIAALDPCGTALAGVVAHKMKRGIIPCDAPIPDAEGKRFVVIGRKLSDGKEAAALVESVKAAGGTVIKMGFLIEESSFKARRTLLRGIPVESRRIL